MWKIKCKQLCVNKEKSFNSECGLLGGSVVKNPPAIQEIACNAGESDSCSVMSSFLQPEGLYSQWNSPGQNPGVGSLSLLQGTFPTQGSNPGFPHCGRILYQLSHRGSLCRWGFSQITSWREEDRRELLLSEL